MVGPMRRRPLASPTPVRRARALGACLIALAGLACSGAPAPAASAPVAASSASEPAEGIARRLLDLSPAFARAVGLHEYDGRIADVSAAGINARIATLRDLKVEVEKLLAAGPSPEVALDLRSLGQTIDLDLFDLTEVESWRTRPAYYSELFSLEEYIVRDYAPKEQRAKAVLSHLSSAQNLVANVLTNLRSPLSEPVLKTAITIYEGFGQYLRGDVQTFLADVTDAALKTEAQRVALALAGEADRIATQLRQVELPRADQSHVLGRQRYERFLLAQEALSTPIEELEQLAEADLARNKAAYEALAGSVQKTRPPVAEMLDEVRRRVESAREFVVSRGIVTLPLPPNIQVKETPPFMRWNSAFLNAGGPFDAAELPAYFYVTLPDPSWPAKEQADYVMSRGDMVSTSTHEVFPGHYLQALWQRSAPTFVQKTASSYSFVEGWAHYSEQMMIEQGFAAELPEARLGQLSDALMRDCRFVASIGIHVRGQSVDEIKRRFVEDCKQDEATARQQAVRGTFDPGYFAYTLGKLQILELRSEAQRALGERFELRKFHDALLSHGAPPIPLIRAQVLADLGVR